ncbi:hypothetical protein OIU79_008113 [Salix purpurea]|uniref:Leucine-rich repeat-containing N-terminal plant-type domain-containing protein n=1 Tax=Salix purpurea TaxID=77065 RepID=A0A9Q0YVV3_SALPP|nr:hypothetical protein OIU79_008113 [Salix purpurea]
MVRIMVRKDSFTSLSGLIYTPIIIQRQRNPSSSSSALVMFLSILLILILLLLPPCHATTVCNQDDHDSLLFLSYHLSSSSPLNWDPSTDCCLWEGVDCDGTADGRVTSLSLPFRDLNGTLAPSLVNLTSLTHLNLSHNRLYGSLPVGFFSSLRSLQVLDLSDNRLDDSMSAITASQAKFLPASATFLSASMTLLDFSSNDFSGNLAPGFGECSKLEIFRAGFNNLSGMIPDDLYKATSLVHFSLPVNYLTGQISDAVVNLTNLKVLELYSNQLGGRIPRDIGKLSKLEQLMLHINWLTGPLPPSLMNCSKLVKLNLRVNFLAGNLSDFDFSTLRKLSTLDLGNNNFTGTFPTSLYSCTSLVAIRLASNQIEGQILPDILALRSLSFLSISANNLTNITGAIRILMGCKNLTTLILSNNTMSEGVLDDGNTLDSTGFQNLQVLALGRCKLSGQVPSWLANISSLQVIDLSYNQIRGSIPGWLDNLLNLFYLDLSNNLLSGEFPLELTGLQTLASQQVIKKLDKSYLELPVFVMPTNATNLQYNQLSSLPPAIYLGSNNLSGSIPVQIGQLKFLHVLDLSDNKFSGNIPDELSNLTNLEKLDLSGNRLSGEIPTSLKGLHFLSSFSVANNDLQGPIPSGGQFDTFPNSSFIGNQWLCGQVLQRSCFGSPGTNHSSAPRKSTNIELVIGLVIGICFGTGLFIALLALWILSKRRIIPGADTENTELDTISIDSGFPPEGDKDASLVVLFPSNTNEIKDLTISELLKATDNFNQANIVGCGGFGLVYKATLGDGSKLAVKKLSGDLGMMEREFRAEVCKPKMSRELVGWVQHMRSEGKQEEVFDLLLRGKGFDDEMLQVLDVACICVSQNPFKRPTIKEVVDCLKNVGSHRNENKD